MTTILGILILIFAVCVAVVVGRVCYYNIGSRFNATWGEK